MALPFETEGAFLTQEQADHINERHVSRDKHVRKLQVRLTNRFSRFVKGCLRTHLGTSRRRLRNTRGLERISWTLLFVRV